MKNPNHSLRGYIARGLFGVASATGLSALASGCIPGITPPPNIDNGNIPASQGDIGQVTPNESNTIDLWEGVLQNSPNNEFFYRITSSEPFRPTGILAGVGDVNSPVNVSLTGDIFVDEYNRTTEWTFRFSDNDNAYKPGVLVPIGVQGIEGKLSGQGWPEDFFINDNLTGIRTFFVRYNPGCPPGQNCGPTPPTTQPAPTYNTDDGICSEGEPATSPDCTPTTLELLSSRANVRAYFVNAQGTPLSQVTTNPATLRFEMSPALERRMASWPFIVEPLENGQSTCLDIARNYSQPQKLSPGVYDTQIYFIKTNPACPTDEAAQFAFSLTDKAGKVWQPIMSDATNISHTVPSYQP